MYHIIKESNDNTIIELNILMLIEEIYHIGT